MRSRVLEAKRCERDLAIAHRRGTVGGVGRDCRRVEPMDGDARPDGLLRGCERAEWGAGLSGESESAYESMAQKGEVKSGRDRVRKCASVMLHAAFICPSNRA